MKKNVINTLKLQEAVGPCRPHDIIGRWSDPEKFRIVSLSNNSCKIEFLTQYFKCKSNHIIIPTNLLSLKDTVCTLTPFIRPNHNVHIFLGLVHYSPGIVSILADLCHTILTAQSRVRITFHIEDTYLYKAVKNHPSLIKQKSCVRVEFFKNGYAKFLCTRWFSFDDDMRRVDITYDDNHHLIIDSHQAVDGIKIVPSSLCYGNTDPRVYAIHEYGYRLEKNKDIIYQYNDVYTMTTLPRSKEQTVSNME